MESNQGQGQSFLLWRGPLQEDSPRVNECRSAATVADNARFETATLERVACKSLKQLEFDCDVTLGQKARYFKFSNL